MAQAVRIIDLTKEDLIALIKENIPQCVPCKETKQSSKVYYTRAETAVMLDVSLTTLNNWRQEGILSIRKSKGRVYYHFDDITNMLSRRT